VVVSGLLLGCSEADRYFVTHNGHEIHYHFRKTTFWLPILTSITGGEGVPFFLSIEFSLSSCQFKIVSTHNPSPSPCDFVVEVFPRKREIRRFSDDKGRRPRSYGNARTDPRSWDQSPGRVCRDPWVVVRATRGSN